MRQRNHWSTLTVTVGYLAATLTGFVRQSFLAFYLGAGREADVFLVAFSIPEFFFIALPIVLSPVIIPLFARVRQQGGERNAAALARRLFAWCALFFLGCTALLWVTAPVYIHWLAPGFDLQVQAESLAQTRQMLPAVFLMALSSLAGGILQVYRSFARPAFVTAVYNLVFTACLALIPLPTAGRAGWGVILGSLMTLLVQLPLLWKLFSATAENRADAARSPVEEPQISPMKVLSLLLPFAAGYGIHHAILLVDRAMATTLGAGDAAALNYARSLSLVIVQVSGLAVSTVMFPALAEHLDQEAYDRACAGLKAALRWVWAVAVPASAVMIVLREPLVRFLFERGAFDAGATASVSLLLAAYSASALADALCQPLWRVIYARGNPWAVVWINLFQTILRIATNVILIPSMGAAGIAISAVIGLASQALILAVLGVARLRVPLGELLEKSRLKETILVLLAAGMAAALAGLLAAFFKTSFSAAGLLLIAGGSGAAVYATVMLLFGDARSIWRGIKAI